MTTFICRAIDHLPYRTEVGTTTLAATCLVSSRMHSALPPNAATHCAQLHPSALAFLATSPTLVFAASLQLYVAGRSSSTVNNWASMLEHDIPRWMPHLQSLSIIQGPQLPARIAVLPGPTAAATTPPSITQTPPSLNSTPQQQQQQQAATFPVQRPLLAEKLFEPLITSLRDVTSLHFSFSEPCLFADARCDAFLSMLSTTPSGNCLWQLHELDLSGCGLGGVPDFRIVATGLPHLRRFIMRNNKLGGRGGVPNFTALRQHKCLRVIDLSANQLTGSPRLSDLPVSIEVVNLMHCWLSGVPFQDFTSPAHCVLPMLRRVALNNNNMSGAPYFKHLWECCPALEEITLNSNDLDGILDLNGLPSSLKKLLLFGNRLVAPANGWGNEPGVPQHQQRPLGGLDLSPLRHCPELTVLNLENNPISSFNHNFSWLDFAASPNILAIGLNHLQLNSSGNNDGDNSSLINTNLPPFSELGAASATCSVRNLYLGDSNFTGDFDLRNLRDYMPRLENLNAMNNPRLRPVLPLDLSTLPNTLVSLNLKSCGLHGKDLDLLSVLPRTLSVLEMPNNPGLTGTLRIDNNTLPPALTILCLSFCNFTKLEWFPFLNGAAVVGKDKMLSTLYINGNTEMVGEIDASNVGKLARVDMAGTQVKTRNPQALADQLATVILWISGVKDKEAVSQLRIAALKAQSNNDDNEDE